MSARDFLRTELEKEYKTYFGLPSREFLDNVVDAWMSDATNSKHRFDAIEARLPGARRILDLASGCGTAVFYGLLHGYDMHGVDPERWKHAFNAMKAAELGYPPEWQARFHDAVGERLPFPDNDFDCVTTYQTLEHVQDVERVILEMVRVTRPGGGIHIQCPDYRGTFEGHYRLPWLPLFPRSLAKLYLRALGRPLVGLDTIQYVTKPKLLQLLEAARARQPGLELRVVDIDEESFRARRRGRRAPPLPGAFARHAVYRHLRTAFRTELTINLFVYVVVK